MQILVVRNGRKESKEETEASLLPSIWPQLPISISCTPAVVHDIEHDNRQEFMLLHASKSPPRGCVLLVRQAGEGLTHGTCAPMRAGKC